MLLCLYVTVSLWLQAGSNVNADSGEHTPLQEAAEQGHTQCVAMLLQHNADVRRMGTCNQNVLDLVVFASLGMFNLPTTFWCLLGPQKDVTMNFTSLCIHGSPNNMSGV